MKSQDKINVRFCMGTTCFVMGASRLQELEAKIPPAWKDKVEVSAQTCLGMCQKQGFMKAPFVQVNDEVIGGATVESVLEKLGELLG